MTSSAALEPWSAVDDLRSHEIPRRDVRLVIADDRPLRVVPFATIADALEAGDVVVLNDASTLPASLRAVTERGEDLELRLVGPPHGTSIEAVVLGAGDHRTRTEHRPRPPSVAPGATLRSGDVALTLIEWSVPERVARLDASVSPHELWRHLFAHGRPVQYAHRPELIPLWDVQTGYAARPWASEMPAAGRPLTWDVIAQLRDRGVEIATVTHAAGLSSIGDAVADAILPLPERYEVPATTVRAITRARERGGRVIAVGTSTVRALECASRPHGLVAGPGVAHLRFGPSDTPRIVDGIVSGLHAPGESHHELLRMFASSRRLEAVLALAATQRLSRHELGDTCLVVRSPASGATRSADRRRR